MRTRAPAWILLSAALLGCHGRGPTGRDADAAYAAAYGYVIQYRTHFFPVAVDRVCLDGSDAGRMEWRMRGSYMPVRADCPYTTPGYVPAPWGRDSVPVISLARGDSSPMWSGLAYPRFPTRGWIIDARGRRRESYLAMLWRWLRAGRSEAEITVRYADPRVQSADVVCGLYRTAHGWGIEECGLLDVKWRGGSATTADDVRGCWRLEWQPLHEEDRDGLPRAVDFTTEPDTIYAPRFSLHEAYRVTPAPGTGADTARSQSHADWSWGWRWRLDDDQLVHFVAGGGFAGFDATLVRDPERETLRGVAVQWDDVGRPSLRDPMWRVVGRRVRCRGDATP